MKILVYVEPTARGEWAIASAEELTYGLVDRIVLLATEDNVRNHPQLLERAAERFAEKKNLTVETRVRPGSARDAILTECKDCAPAITVFPPAGRSTLSRVFRGSRVKAVMHNSPSTVMVARKPVSDRIRRILVTVSGGPMSETTLLSALEVRESARCGTRSSPRHLGSGPTATGRTTVRTAR